MRRLKKLQVEDKCGNLIVELAPSRFSEWRRSFATTHGKQPRHIALLLRTSDGGEFIVDTAAALRRLKTKIADSEETVACELLERVRPPTCVEHDLSDCDIWRAYAPREGGG